MIEIGLKISRKNIMAIKGSKANKVKTVIINNKLIA